MFFDLIVSYELAHWIVKENGHESWLKYLKRKYPEKEIYKVSTDWFHNKKYICKARGSKGDLLIGWED